MVVLNATLTRNKWRKDELHVARTLRRDKRVRKTCSDAGQRAQVTGRERRARHLQDNTARVRCVSADDVRADGDTNTAQLARHMYLDAARHVVVYGG